MNKTSRLNFTSFEVADTERKSKDVQYTLVTVPGPFISVPDRDVNTARWKFYLRAEYLK